MSLLTSTARKVRPSSGAKSATTARSKIVKAAQKLVKTDATNVKLDSTLTVRLMHARMLPVAFRTALYATSLAFGAAMNAKLASTLTSC